MNGRHIFYAVFFIALLFDGCDDGAFAVHDPEPGDSIYNAHEAMMVYATAPHRALLIIDSAEIVGNVTPLEADILRATVFTQTDEEYIQPDSAITICRRLLEEDSLDADDDDEKISARTKVLRIICTAYREKEDNEQLLRYSTELSELNRRLGNTTEALRTEAEIAVVMTRLGQRNKGMAMLDDIIRQLDVAGSVDKMDAAIVAMRRKIGVLIEQEHFADIVPLAQRIIEKVDHYQEHPEGYADDSFRLEPDSNRLAGYCDFCRAHAYGYLAIALSSPSTERDDRQARQFLERLEQTDFGQTYGGRKMAAAAWRNLGEYDKMLSIYEEVEKRLGGDTLNRDYADILADRALAAQHQGRLNDACGLWARHHRLMNDLSDEQSINMAHDYAARYNARERELKLEAFEADSKRKSVIIGVFVLLIIVGLVISIYFRHQRQAINKKNHLLAQQITEALNYKEKYLKLKDAIGKLPSATGSADATAPPLDAATPAASEEAAATPTPGLAALTGADDSTDLFRFLYKDILDNQLYLDPCFDRQSVADRYGLNNVQVGAAFAQGSKDYSSVSDFIRACRLEHACRLLTTTDMRIAEVASASGFTRTTTFNHDFKARYNLSPTEFRGQQ